MSEWVDAEVLERSIEYGKTIASEIYDYSVTDGQDQCYASNFPTSYTPPVGDGLWVPTPPAFQSAMQPYWGNVRPFVTDNITNVLFMPKQTKFMNHGIHLPLNKRLLQNFGATTREKQAPPEDILFLSLLKCCVNKMPTSQRLPKRMLK